MPSFTFLILVSRNCVLESMARSEVGKCLSSWLERQAGVSHRRGQSEPM